MILLLVTHDLYEGYNHALVLFSFLTFDFLPPLRLSGKWRRIMWRNWLYKGGSMQNNGKNFFNLMPKGGNNGHGNRYPLLDLVVINNPVILSTIAHQAVLTTLELVCQWTQGADTKTLQIIILLRGPMTLTETSSVRGVRIMGKRIIGTKWCMGAKFGE